MEILRDLSLEITLWLQNNYPQLEAFFQIFAVIGYFEFYLAAITLIYWSVNKQLGRSLAYLISISYLINSILKHILGDPRPYWLDPSIGLSTEDSYGVPSGHAQGATVFYGALAMWIRRPWAWLLAIVIILLMALSRIYLGVHDLEDVLAGILVGVIILIGYYLWQRYIAVKFANRILGQRLLLAVLAPLAFVAIYVVALLLLGQPDEEVPWVAYIDAAEIASFKNMATITGGILGLGIGFILEVSRVRFIMAGPVWKRGLRYLIGIGSTLLLRRGLDYLMPDGPFGLVVFIIALQNFLLSLWVAYYAPWAFVRLRLADARPEPEVTITL